MVVNIISLNVRGLREAVKRRAIFEQYWTRCDVLCLQETHSDDECECIWSHEWGGDSIMSHGTSQARGVAIFIKRQAGIDVFETNKSNDGRSCSCKLLVGDIIVQITNIYAPNKDTAEFYTQQANYAHNNCDRNIIIGDFNAVLDPALDAKSGNHANSRSSTVLNDILQEYNMIDVWRCQNPQVKRYSWFQNCDHKRASRIDYALVSAGLNGLIHDTFYLVGIQTDHSAYFIGMNTEVQSRGPSFWKMNINLLQNIDLVKKINTTIEQSINETHGGSALHKWECIKKKVRRCFQDYSIQKSNEEKIAISQLADYITEMENNYQEINEKDIQLLSRSKAELNELTTKRVKGVMFRTRTKWTMEGEKNTRYFLNLEKSKYNAKTCTSLIVGDQTITDPSRIMQAQEDYYRKLHTSDQSVQFSIPNVVENPAHETSIGALNDQFSIEEVKKVTKDLKNGSCPGSDGLPVEFYKMFWPYIEKPLYEMILEVYERGSFHETARGGILNLIPKGQKDTRYLKNLRPITLLNVDYKIVEKCVANRMIPALNDVIHSDQRGFLPGRQISINIRKILDAVTSAEEEQTDGLIISCDYMKCFDRVEIPGVLYAMKYFQFSELLIEWVKIMYSQYSIRVQNNGYFSNNIPVTRSVHQGGPASNGLFLQNF